MRPKTKDGAQKLTLTLSAPARKTLMSEAMRRGVSRTQVVEELILHFSSQQKLVEGKANARRKSGESASVILDAFDGGLQTPHTNSNPICRANLSV
jgi:hypothetical protein